MSLCDKCVHCSVCGTEDAREKIGKAPPFLYMCGDFIDRSILAVSKKEEETPEEIINHAKVLKEYCDNRRDCYNCVFNVDDENRCKLFGYSIPSEWELED